MTETQKIIEEKIGIIPKPWQVSIMVDIVYEQKNIIVLAVIGKGKSWPYMLIPLIKASAIILVVSSTILH